MRIYGTKLQIDGANIKSEYFPFRKKERKRERKLKIGSSFQQCKIADFRKKIWCWKYKDLHSCNIQTEDSSRFLSFGRDLTDISPTQLPEMN